jgi:DNA-directed RNA polymerase specialized sigma24 family protein
MQDPRWRGSLTSRLRYIERLSEEEVAKALDVTLGTVKKNAFRARETLRKRLGNDGDE